MKSFAERNPFVIGAVGVGLTLAVTLAALNYDKVPFFNQAKDYSAYFAEAGGLIPGAPVQVSGLRVGKVDSVDLDGPKVRHTHTCAPTRMGATGRAMRLITPSVADGAV